MTQYPEPCNAVVHASNEDGILMCDLTAGHPGDHWDPEYGAHFRSVASR